MVICIGVSSHYNSLFKVGKKSIWRVLFVEVVEKWVDILIFIFVVVLLTEPAARLTRSESNAARVLPISTSYTFALGRSIARAATSVTIASKSSTHGPLCRIPEIGPKRDVHHLAWTTSLAVVSRFLWRLQILKPLKIHSFITVSRALLIFITLLHLYPFQIPFNQWNRCFVICSFPPAWG